MSIATLYTVVVVEPDWPWLPAETMAAVRHISRRALKKDPFQWLSDIRNVQSQLALRLLAAANGRKRVGLAPVNPENSCIRWA
jgi:hypothetical protein